MLEGEFEAGRSYLPNKADWFEGRWAGLGQPDEPSHGAPQHRHRDRRRSCSTSLGQHADHGPRRTSTIHKTLQPHPRRQEGRCSRAARASTGRPPRRWPSAAWSPRAIGVRLSGQDSGRGTFSQRHAVWVDQNDERQIYPADHRRRTAASRCCDSPLSEFGVLGFEYGYSLADPQDAGAVGSAVRRFRQRRADRSSTSSSPPAKPSGCAPAASSCCCRTAIEGQGPEHSSARLERYPAALRRGQYAGRQLHHAGQLFPHPAPADACAISASR